MHDLHTVTDTFFQGDILDRCARFPIGRSNVDGLGLGEFADDEIVPSYSQHFRLDFYSTNHSRK